MWILSIIKYFIAVHNGVLYFYLKCKKEKLQYSVCHLVVLWGRVCDNIVYFSRTCTAATQ